MIKAVFFDIDGTLVSFATHLIPISTKEALKKLRRKGIKLFVASGRHMLSINNLESLQFDGYVTLNGGMCLINDELIYKRAIPQKDIWNLKEYLNTEQEFPCVMVQQDKLIMNFMDETTKSVFTMLNFPVPPIESFDKLTDDVYQMLFFLREEQEKKIMHLLPDCRTTRWNPLFTDVVPLETNKWIGIRKILEHFNIKPEETMAFGDGGNDIEMIEKAKIGVAMGNASEDLKKIADYVTDSVDNDGIEKALTHFGLL